ncbi:MAG: DUF2490 domain-containing protein [Pyrinomonadaceae bacterium]
MKHLLILALFVFPTVCTAQADNSDFQVWNETSVSFPINDSKTVSALVFGNLRVTDNVSKLSDKRIGFGVEFKTKHNITIFPNYLFRVDTSSNNAKYEHRLRFDITPNFKFKKFSIENRSRFEQHLRLENRKDNTFYRNRTKANIPLKIGGETKFGLFISNETFFDIRNGRLYRNDIGAGFSQKVSPKLSLEYFYQYRHNFDSGTKHINVVGVNLKIKTK